jgi:hypothetical protein
MKTATQPAIINPVIIILSLLTAAVVFLGWKGTTLPLLSNPKVSLAVVLLLGMAICAQGGIGRVAAAGQWTHPLSIAGYLLGAAILLLAAAVFLNIELPFIASPQPALVVIAALMAGKVFISVVHYLIS